jgi:hypothetical protein
VRRPLDDELVALTFLKLVEQRRNDAERSAKLGRWVTSAGVSSS